MTIVSADGSAPARPRVSRRIDPDSGIPLYLQLREILQQDVESLPLGERLPSEPEIAATYGVSRATVRHAISELEREGLVERRRGAGTFVAQRRNLGWQIQSEHGWYEDITRRGHIVHTEVLRRGLEPAPDWVTHALGLPPGEKVIRLDRLRSVNSDIATFVRNYLHPELCAPVLDADLTWTSLYAWLERNCGVSLAEGPRTIRAVVADDHLASLFRVSPGSPLLEIEAVSFDATKGPFEVYECWHRADLTSIAINVSSR